MERYETVTGEVERDGWSYFVTARFSIARGWAELMELTIDSAPKGGIELTDFELQKLEYQSLAA